TDLSRCHSAKHFTSLLTLSPGSTISGGKVLSAHSRKTNYPGDRASASCGGVGRTNQHGVGRILSSALGTDRQDQGGDGHRTKNRGVVLQRDALRHGVCRPRRKSLRTTVPRAGGQGSASS